MGAWIEISYIYRKKYNDAQVAPLMGAWIEIGNLSKCFM